MRFLAAVEILVGSVGSSVWCLADARHDNAPLDTTRLEYFNAQVVTVPATEKQIYCYTGMHRLYAKYGLSEADIDRIVEMAWEDRTPFEAITAQFKLPESEVIELMKLEMHPRNWQKWRARVHGRVTKHRNLRNDDVQRFKCSRQKHITQNRISKR